MVTTAEANDAPGTSGMPASSRPVHEGDRLLAADDAVAEVAHFDGSLTRLDTGATAFLRRIADGDGRPHVVLLLGPGASWHQAAAVPGRRGQYEAHTPAGVALARAATFVARVEEGGDAWFAVLAGTAVVRGRDGGTVVLQPGEHVHCGADGTLGDVERPGFDVLVDEDEWVAVNELLDAEAFGDDTDDTPSPGPGDDLDGPLDPDAVDLRDAVGASLGAGDRDHPWRVGVAAVLAIGVGIASLVIGRSAGRPASEARSENEHAIGVPGPPAFSGPALTAPRVPTTVDTAETPPRRRRQQPGAGRVATVAPIAQPRYNIAGRSCTRAPDGVTYTGTITNLGPAPRLYKIEVRFLDSRDRVVANASVSLSEVQPQETRTFTATGSGTGVQAAGACEVGAVTAFG